jgi:hypothetical protein
MFTSADPYLPPAPVHVEFDPDGKLTQKDLVRYSALLAKRIKKLGPPPYNCPAISENCS